MPKTFYTERDIEDMVRQGNFSLELTDDVVLTELAYERAERLGMNLIREHATPPAAPVRPYISSEMNPKPAAQGTGFSQGPSIRPVKSQPDLKQRVRDAVVARLGGQVDPVLLDTIIKRVLNSVGIK